MRTRAIAEVVTFKLKAGVSEADFLLAADVVQSHLQEMSGYLGCELLNDEQGQWIDLVYWRSMAEAHAAAELLMALPSAGPFIGLIDETSTAMHHLHQARTYNIA